MRCSAGNEFERLRDGRTFMCVRTDVRPLLRFNGLMKFRDFIDYSGGDVVNSHGWRHVVRMDLDDEQGTKTVFLKRFGAINLKDAVGDILRFRRVRTKALIEFDMLCRFRTAGIDVPRVLACGERHLLGRDRESFLMLDVLSRGRPLSEVIGELACSGRRNRLIASAAAFVRGMHDAGLVHVDLYAKHLFVDENADGTWHVSVIDLQRAHQSNSVTDRMRGRDVAGLLVSLPPSATSAVERLRFLLEYLDTDRADASARRFINKNIMPRAKKLSRRTVYKSWRALLEST